MKEQPEMGVNRTGVQMSPFDTGEMTSDTDVIMQGEPGNTAALADMRKSYVIDADPLGSVPVPATVTGMLTTGASMLTGNSPQLLLDKLGERLAFERTGTRLYDALITKVQALQPNGESTLSVQKLEQIRDDEARHFRMVADAIRSIGGDPTSQTPCADVAGVEASGLMQVVCDPRTTVAQSLHAILVAEMTDNNGWETLIALAGAQNHDAMVADFTDALHQERDHLQQVQLWLEEATLGAPITRLAGAADQGAAPLH